MTIYKSFQAVIIALLQINIIIYLDVVMYCGQLKQRLMLNLQIIKIKIVSNDLLICSL